MNGTPSMPNSALLIQIRSSLDCRVWHSFCSFLYSRVYIDRLGLSSDIINCINKTGLQPVSRPVELVQ